MKKSLVLVLVLAVLGSAVIIAGSVKLVRQNNEVVSLSEQYAQSNVTPAQTPEPQPEKTPYPEGTKILYLTFDDGPSEYTERLLDILDSYGVKATFFVTGDCPEYATDIKRAYESGHSIGIHCMHHYKYRMYDGYESFWKDFEEIDTLIFEQTGVHTKIMRFPGGSSNRRTGKIPGMMTELSKEVTEKGYRYFDWEAMSGDAEKALSEEDVLNSCKEAALGCTRYCMILNHDTFKTTVEAMGEFIPWALENGFVFEPVDEHTPEIHHQIKN